MPGDPIPMTQRRFEELVGEALDLIPAQLAAAMDNVVVLVEDRNEREPDLLGLYEGVALTERTSEYSGASAVSSAPLTSSGRLKSNRTSLSPLLSNVWRLVE